MKKLVKILALTLVCVLGIVALVACGGASINTNYDEAVANLKANGYTVMEAKGDDSSLAGFVLMYGIQASDVEAAVMATKGEEEDGEEVSILWLKSEDAAKKVVEAAEAMYDAEKEMADAMGLDLPSIKIGRSGNVAYMGTNAAIKATNA